jgi:ubiquitin C-terminal hydrolase
MGMCCILCLMLSSLLTSFISKRTYQDFVTMPSSSDTQLFLLSQHIPYREHHNNDNHGKQSVNHTNSMSHMQYFAEWLHHLVVKSVGHTKIKPTLL